MRQMHILFKKNGITEFRYKVQKLAILNSYSLLLILLYTAIKKHGLLS